MTGVAIAIGVLIWTEAPAQPEVDAVAALAREGWQAARQAAKSAGTPESLAPAARVLAALDDELEHTFWPLQVTYARSLIAAAMAAAQDERAVMEVHLTHARDLSDRLKTSQRPAEWPLPFDEAAAELWFEVNEYAEALRAYERAVAVRPQSSSWLGLARSAARLKDVLRACDAYRQLAQMPLDDAELQETREYLAACP